MDHLQQAAFLVEERKAHNLTSELLGIRIAQIDSLDPFTDFALIVGRAQEAGLGKDELLEELSCAWSTITRWSSGQVQPARFTRQAIKAKLVEMLERKRRAHLDEARRVEAA